MRLSPAVRSAILNNADFGHQHVLAAFPRAHSGSPRSEFEVLWALNSSEKLLVVQSAVAPTTPEVLGEVLDAGEVSSPSTGAALEVTVSIAPQKTPTANVPPELRQPVKSAGGAYRSRLVMVPEAERPAWFTQRMARIGFRVDAESIRMSPQSRVSLGSRGRSIPAVTIRATGTVADSEAFTTAVRSGIGKGRNYGLGLIRFHNLSN